MVLNIKTMVNIMTFKFRKIATTIAFSLLTITNSYNALAAPGALPSLPLFDTNISVEPNVYFTIDDSGSMDWEVFFEKGVTKYDTDNAAPLFTNFWIQRRVYITPKWNDKKYLIPSLADDNDTWLFRNPVANPIYYDTNINYIPWKGKDASGTTDLYGNADYKAVQRWPGDTTDTIDLTAEVEVEPGGETRFVATFCTWDEDIGSEGIDESDPHTCVQIKAGNESYFGNGRTTVEAELNNFANWLQYYRKREFAAKSAIGAVINTTNSARMGLRFINSDTTVALKTMTDGTNKNHLITTYYAGKSSGYTPLRQALEKTGEMFRTDSNAILSKEKGGECQQNFNVLITDGYWNRFDPDDKIGDADSDYNTDFDGNAAHSIDHGNYADTVEQSLTLADVAMYYYENDLRADLANTIPTTPGKDVASHQHLVNYAVAFGLTGTLPLDANPTDKGFEWPKVVSDEKTTLDDLRHAAYNSRGLFLSASNAQILSDALLTAVINITDRLSYASAASVTSAKLSTESLVFLALYNTDGWQGDIAAHTVKEVSTGELNPIPIWNAATKLNDRDITTSPRTILTYDNTTKKDGVAFEWDNLTTAMQDDLKTTCKTNDVVIAEPNPDECYTSFDKVYCPVTEEYYNNSCEDQLIRYLSPKTANKSSNKKHTYDKVPVYYCYEPTAGGNASSNICNTDADNVTAKARLAYLRGDRTNEGTAPENFRKRVTPLGDIVNAGPVYAAAPILNIPDIAPFPTGANAYSQFKKDQSKRTGVVYAASNDGMLHGFLETNGNEVLAYLPSYLASTSDLKGFHYLTEQNYNHMFYNDLTPTIADAYINTGTGTTDWHTILVGGQRGGGRGYFALDITDPDNFSEDKASDIVLWEFSSANDADLGYTYSQPQIGKMKDGSWVAIFGNGYNSTGDGEAKLFIVKLEGGTDGAWTEDTDYYKITTGSGTALDINGLATPALADIDGDGIIDRAYAGDLKGNMWVFDLTSDTFAKGALAYSEPLFTTEGALPITSKPVLSFHPTEYIEGNEPNLMVFFGSGQFLVESDKLSTNDEYFYGVWDNGHTELTRTDLVEQTFVSSSPRILSQNAVDYTNNYGWNIKLPDTGERAITTPAVRGDIVFFNTSVPLTSACSSGGYGYRFAVDLATGGTPSEPVFDYDDSGVIDSGDTIGEEHTVPSADRLESFPTDNTFTERVGYNGKDPFVIKELPEPRLGRFSWQELLK